MKLYVWREIVARYHSRTVDLIETSLELRERYRTAWLREYTPYRLPAALARWDEEARYWLNVKDRLTEWAGSYKDGQEVPPLSTVLTRR